MAKKHEIPVLTLGVDKSPTLYYTTKIFHSQRLTTASLEVYERLIGSWFYQKQLSKTIDWL